MHDSAPFFSVVIPTYNRVELLAAAIRSVLSQTFPNFELIVVDNCSTDGTPQMMARYAADARVSYIRNPCNMERGYSRNVGFRAARGRFLTLLDSDDLMYPPCLRDAYDYAQSNASLMVFHNLWEIIDREGKPARPVKFPPVTDVHKAICKGNFVSCVGVFLAREVYQQFFFNEDPRMIGSEDYEIWFRVLAHYSLGRIDKINCGVRDHEERSVHSAMYENLEYQRAKVVEMIERDAVLSKRYGKYIGYINANYSFHKAMFSLAKRQRAQAWRESLKSLTRGRGMLWSRRSLAFGKNLISSFIGHP